MTKTAKLFMNGRSQAVRLPKEFRFEGKEVRIERSGDKIILMSKSTNKKPTWDEYFAQKPRVPKDFMSDRKDEPPQERIDWDMLFSDKPESPKGVKAVKRNLPLRKRNIL